MITEVRSEVLRLFAEGRIFYKKLDFVKAMEKFKEALTLDPDDGPSAVFELRCRYYIANPPREDWDGVFVMENK